MTRTLVLLLLVAMFPLSAEALPRFAVREGADCSQCHVDPSGGGMRNDYGRSVFEVVELPRPGAVLPEDAAPMDARVNDTLALGADFRLLYQDLTRADADVPRVHSFYLMEASPYVAADLSGFATLYLAPTFSGSETVLFEAMGLVPIPAVDGYLKLGRFTPAYGWKLANHSTFIRKQLGFNVTRKEVGLELGLRPWDLDFRLGVFNGVSDANEGDWDENPHKGLALRAAYRLKTRPVKLELGVSGYYNLGGNAPEDDPTGEETRLQDLRAGVFAGLGIGRLTWLGEADLQQIDDRTQPEAVGRFASYQELSLLVARGVDVMATYELWDDETDASGNAVHRYGGGVEYFPWPFVELALYYRYAQADTRHPMAGLHEALAVAHLFY